MIAIAVLDGSYRFLQQPPSLIPRLLGIGGGGGKKANEQRPSHSPASPAPGKSSSGYCGERAAN